MFTFSPKIIFETNVTSINLHLKNMNRRTRPEGIANDGGTRLFTPRNKHGFQRETATEQHRGSEEHPVQGELVHTLVVGVAYVQMTVVVDRQTFRLQLSAHSRQQPPHTPLQLVCHRIVGVDPVGELTGDEQLLGSQSRETHTVVEVLSVDEEHNVGYSCEYRRVGAAVEPDDDLWVSGIVDE